MRSAPDNDTKRDPKAERVSAILAAALEEFYAQGFATARLDAIAERAGIGKGTIYLYFDSKEALFEAAVRSVILPVLEKIERLAGTPQTSAADILKTVITTLYREVIGTEKRRLLRLFIAEGPRFPRLLAFYHGEVISRGMTMIRGILAYGVARGEFRPSPAMDVPQVVIGPAMVGAIWKMLFDELEPLDLDALCKAHLDVMLNGLLQRENTHPPEAS